MIEVNLLPPEYRKVEKTPLPVFLLLLACVILITSSGFALAYFHLAVLPEKKQIMEEKKQAAKDAKELKGEIAKLQEQSQSYQDRLDMIIQAARTRILWSKKLVILSKLKDNTKDLWFEDIMLEQDDIFKEQAKIAAERKSDKNKQKNLTLEKRKTIGKLTLSCRHKGDGNAPMRDFMSDLRNHKIFSPDFAEVRRGTVVQEVIENAIEEDSATKKYDIYLDILPPRSLQKGAEE